MAPPRSSSRRSIAGEPGGRTPLVIAFAIALCVATIGLLTVGYRATTEWRRSELLLAERRASEKLALLVSALDRDMRGAQLSVLVPITQEQLAAGNVAGLATLFARAFARFPYPETFFVWSERGAQEATYIFNRANRRPPWDGTTGSVARNPVVTTRAPTPLDPLVDRIRRDASHRRRFAAYHVDIAGVPYEAVVHLLYDEVTGTGRLIGLVGYTVNLAWVRTDYFRELVQQVARIGGDDDDTALMVLDGAGRPVAATSSAAPAQAPHARRFPLRFYDVNLTLPGERVPEQWVTQAVPSRQAAELAGQGGQRLLALMALAALASIVGIVVIGRALMVKAELISMKSEFVSAVTHELKTPLSLMRLVADTLVTGRYTGPEKVKEYGGLLSAEVDRMSHLIDNLLSFARVTRVENLYEPVRLDLVELLEEAAGHVQSRLDALGFTLNFDVGAEPLSLTADRTAMLMVLDNLLDNAIKYSPDPGSRAVTLRGRREGAELVVEVEDRGEGIHADDLPKVLGRFFRGRQARGGGSGLGLSIVDQIVRDHGGRVDVRSGTGTGTTVTLTLPAA